MKNDVLIYISFAKVTDQMDTFSVYGRSIEVYSVFISKIHGNKQTAIIFEQKRVF